MTRQCCQCAWFQQDLSYRESCIGRCKSPRLSSNDLISGYSEAGWDSTFYPNGRECPGFMETTRRTSLQSRSAEATP